MRLSSLLLLLCLPTLLACTSVQPATTPLVAANSTVPLPTATPANQSGAGQDDAAGEEVTPKLALERLFTSEQLSEEWFATSFLDQISPSMISDLLADLREQLGSFERIEGDSSPFTVIFTLGTVPTEISLDADGSIVGIFFHPPTLNVATVDEAVTLISELPGDVNLLVLQNGEEIASLNANTPLAVGSGFKLAILSMLRDQIEAGAHSWDEVVSLAPEWKSLPTGILQNWPDDSLVTLQTLATLMISISDNTATDALIQIVGREEIEAITPRNRPLLTTQELFKLKAVPNADLLERYRNGDEAEKRQVIEELATVPLPTIQEMSTAPLPDVEWFFTPNELCELMAQVEDLPLMTVEPGPGVAQPEQWAHVAFKGGSELGVFNLTTWLETAEGTSYCVTMTQNNAEAPANEAEFISLYRSLVMALE